MTSLLHRHVVIEGCTFRLGESPGPPDSPCATYVLVHGIGMSHRSLARLHDALSGSAPVISVDLPGFGGVPKPPRDLDVREMGRLLAGVLTGVGERPVILVGHSMGAQWVVEAARRISVSQVQAVVLIGPVVDERRRTVSAQARALALDTLLESPLANALVFVDYLRCGVAWYLAQSRHMVAYSTEEGVRELQMPVLVVRGAHDPVAGRSWSRRLRDIARQGRLIDVPGHHHVVPFTAPLAVADAIMSVTRDTRPAIDDIRAIHGRSSPSGC